MTEQDDPAIERPAAAAAARWRPRPLRRPHGLGAAMRPLADADALSRAKPFLAVVLIALVLAALPPTSSSSTPALIEATALTAVILMAARGIPWRRLPAWCEALVPFTFFIVIALLRHAGGGAVSGYAAMVMLPILWTAIYGSRTQLLLAIAGAAGMLVLPLIFLGPPLYPGTGWRGAVLWVAIGLLAGSAIQTLVGQARQRTADVAALGAVTRALTAGSDPRPELCAAAQLVTDAAFAVLFEEQIDGTLVATAGTAGVDLGPMRIDPRTEFSATAEAWRTRSRIYLANTTDDPLASARMAGHTGAVAVLFQPVIRDGRPTAVLVVGFRESRPQVPALALDMVELVAAEIAAAIDRADLLALFAAQARTDPLTGAANRRSWDEEMERAVARTRRTAEPLTVALIDMDHFKAYNDTFGHEAGDAVLRELVAAVRIELRTGDLIARWGGEEFALALPGCDLREAHIVASRLLRVVPSGQTVSIGLTQAGPLDTPRTLIGRADRALYAAKDGGRNQVRSLQAPPSAPTPTARRQASA